MTESTARRTLATLLDPATVIDARRMADVADVVVECAAVAHTMPDAYTREDMLTLCDAVEARYSLTARILATRP